MGTGNLVRHHFIEQRTDTTIAGQQVRRAGCLTVQRRPTTQTFACSVFYSFIPHTQCTHLRLRAAEHIISKVQRQPIHEIRITACEKYIEDRNRLVNISNFHWQNNISVDRNTNGIIKELRHHALWIDICGLPLGAQTDKTSKMNGKSLLMISNTLYRHEKE